MAAEDAFVPLGSLVDTARGISYGVVQPGQPTPHGVPIARVTDIRHGRISTTEPLRVSPEIEAKYQRTRLKGGELLLTLVGTVGETAIVPETMKGWNTARAVAVIPVREDVGARWVQLALHSSAVQEFIHTRLNTTVQATLNLRDVAALPIPLPSLETRRAITHILGTLDDKIDLNLRMNETLKAMAQALFKSWFVDFDPVRAKDEGRRPLGMDSETARLFPADFEKSSLGEIPKGWRHIPVRDVCEGLYDGPHATPPESDSGAVFLGIKNFTPTSLDLTEVRHIAEADYPTWTKRVVPAHEDIVFTYEATLGFFALIPPGLRCCLGRRTALVRPLRNAPNAHFLFHWFTAPPFQEFLRAHRHPGSTVERILLKEFPNYPVLQPSAALVTRFEEAARPIWARIHSNQAEAATLRSLRDGLLPRLLSGELSVSDATYTATATVTA